MAYLAAHRRYMLGMQRKIHDLAQKMSAQQRRFDEARLALVEATKQRRILEKLREHQHEQWEAQQARREAGELDELSTQLAYQTLVEQSEGER
jgi:flagellar export protein FliJ